MNDRAKSTLILAILCAAILLVILAGCSDDDATSKDYVRHHDCRLLYDSLPDPIWRYDPLATWNEGHAYTQWSCDKAEPIKIEFVNGRPWRP
jgi:hypothetical protein